MARHSSFNWNVKSARGATDTTVCVTVTQLDGLVAGRSAFHHSMNYRSAVVIGQARLVDDPAEKARALALIVDHLVPARSATLRPDTRKELAATAGPWGGHVPRRLVAGDPGPDADSSGAVPGDVVARARDLGAVPPATPSRPVASAR